MAGGGDLILTLNLDESMADVLAIVAAIGELYDLVPDYVAERDEIVERVRARTQRLLKACRTKRCPPSPPGRTRSSG